MQWRYIVKRLFLLFPTLFIVCLIAFLLKNKVPGDSVEIWLNNQGASIQDRGFKNTEYEKIYKQLSLHKPVFYFSILPHFYPDNIHSIILPERRQTTKKLLSEGYRYHDIHSFLMDIDSMLESKLNSKVVSQQNAAWKKLITFQQNPATILQQIQKNPALAQNEMLPFIHKVQSIEQNKVTFFWPTIRWYGLDNQFHKYLSSVIKFDFGTSLKDGQQVTYKLKKALLWTFFMILISSILLFMISIPLGLWSGRYENSLLDIWTERISILLYAIPVFWLASMLIIFFTSDEYSSWLHIFPSVGTWYEYKDQGFLTSFISHAKQLILPVICLILNDFAFLIRFIKSSTIREKNLPYIKVAIAKGLTDQQVLFKHLLPNVSINIISVLIGMIPAAFAGSLIVEVIFNIPGMGRLLYNSILYSDWNVVYGILLVLSTLTILFNLIGDLLFVRLNPKIKYDG
ncbi:MAG: ABC transporter permease [Saprospiraceae bacterium]